MNKKTHKIYSSKIGLNVLNLSHVEDAAGEEEEKQTEPEDARTKLEDAQRKMAEYEARLRAAGLL